MEEYNTNTLENKPEVVFDAILAPAMPKLREIGDGIAGDAEKYTLSFVPFTINLLYAIIYKIKGQRLISTHIATNPDAKTAGLVHASQSMYSEAFIRYEPHLFRPVLYSLLKGLSFLGIPEIEALGTIWCVDGSLFPAIASMEWAKYKKTANAIKLHLAFELNRMIPVEFICTEGNGSEKGALKKIIKAGITYVMDRGYVSFPLFAHITVMTAYFVTRIKKNLLYTVKETLDVFIPSAWQSLFCNVTDESIVFANDEAQLVYRRVSFVAMGEAFVLLTNRFDLTTGQVIMLYAYRWQVELFFRSYKRTLNGLHLYCHDPNGIEVQFVLHMISYVLLIAFKQQMAIEKDRFSTESAESTQSHNIELPSNGVSTSLFNSKAVEKLNLKENSQDKMVIDTQKCSRGLVSFLGKKLQRFWKLGIHWLTKLNILLFRPLTPEAVCVLGD